MRTDPIEYPGDVPSSPRTGDTITTAEELDALPLDSIVVNSEEWAWQKRGGRNRWYSIGHEGSRREVPYLPATVLYVPGEQAHRSIEGPTECDCRPCAGRGIDGHGMSHCAECCFGTGVEADPGCPIHGEQSGDVPSSPRVAEGAVEAAARAAFDTDNAGGHIRGQHTWESIPEEGRRSYRLMVSAVLAAAARVLPAPPDREAVTQALFGAVPYEALTRREQAQVDAVLALFPGPSVAEVREQERERIVRELLAERDRARAAHQAANADHFAHDYCRWVGHAEALTSAADRVARGGGDR